MADLSNVSMDDMLNDPRAHFKHPDAVVASTELDAEMKGKILRRWEEDERALIRAGSEAPMTGGEQPMLNEVEKALDDLHQPKAN